MRIGLFVAMLGCLVVLCSGCGDGSGSVSPPVANLRATSPAEVTEAASSGVVAPVHLKAEEATTESPTRPSLNLHPEIVIRTSLGNIRVRLDREKAPRTTENFLVNYVERGWYANTIIHHVEPQSMIMGGAYLSGMKPKLTSAEIAERGILNEANNGLSNRRGTLAMARLADYEHSATSEFFINLASNDHLDYAQTEDGRLNGYCVFGKVIEGLEIADKIAALPAKPQTGGEGGARIPTEPVVILAIEQVGPR